MSNLSEIAEGYTNLLLKKVGLTSQELEWLAKVRLEHCKICTLDPNNRPGLVDNRCVICNCLMEAKVRAIKSKCPAGKW